MRLFALFALLLSLAGVSPAFGAGHRIDVVSEHGEGSVVISGGDYIDARQRARDAAMHDAIWKAIVALSSAEQVGKNADAIFKGITSHAMDFTHSFKFNEEKIDPENHAYVVSMEVTFFSDVLSASLEKIGMKVAERPKAVVIVDEQTFGGAATSSFLLSSSPTEKILAEVLEDNGFKAVTRNGLRQLKMDAEIIKAVKGDEQALKWLGGSFKAELVITGTAGSTEAGGKITGVVSIKIYDGETAELLWSKEVSKSVESSNHADKFKVIRLAAEKVKEYTNEYLSPPPTEKKEHG
ncbi:MAG: hypothetical protein HY280_09755 [Nitrospinae bacterium]|nr:hypothetical protein [Nitrospinota bacterium]